MNDDFLAAMSRAANTVCVVTTDGMAGRFGVTVSAMTSVSAEDPGPSLLVCVHHLSPACEAIQRNRVFCANVLGSDQTHISDCFAGRTGAKGLDKFDCADWATGETGAPVLLGAQRTRSRRAQLVRSRSKTGSSKLKTPPDDGRHQLLGITPELSMSKVM